MKSISDVSWSKFLEYLSYKAQWYGRECATCCNLKRIA
ncbi:hypothetical protein MWH25_11495 [Natroniella acetigena]|nr:hypothetical protein [Natroniella acetigena]